MSGPTHARRLMAIWFADVVGFSALTSVDEDLGVAVAEALQVCARSAAEGHRGRIVKFVGDAAIAVFDSTENALLGALALRDAFEAHPVTSPHGITLRTGVHLCELVETEGGDVLGDGVNVAARIQARAEPHEILISGAVHRQVRYRSTYHTESRGEHTLKGLGEPMRLYSLVRVGEARPAPRPGAGEEEIAAEAAASEPSSQRSSGPSHRRVVAIGIIAGLVTIVGVGGALGTRRPGSGLFAPSLTTVRAIGTATRVPTGRSPAHVALSPQARSVAWVAEPEADSAGAPLYVVTLEKPVSREFRVRAVGRPEWTADGTRVVYASVGDAEREAGTYELHTETGDIHRIAPFFPDRWRLAPNGTEIATCEPGARMWGECSVLVSQTLDRAQTDTIFEMNRNEVIRDFDWSADGDRLLVLVRSREALDSAMVLAYDLTGEEPAASVLAELVTPYDWVRWDWESAGALVVDGQNRLLRIVSTHPDADPTTQVLLPQPMSAASFAVGFGRVAYIVPADEGPDIWVQELATGR